MIRNYMLTKRHDKVQLIRSLERELEWHNDRVVHQRQHRALRKDVRDFARTGGNVRLADRLESVYAVRVLLPDLHNFAERAFPNDLE